MVKFSYEIIPNSPHISLNIEDRITTITTLIDVQTAVDLRILLEEAIVSRKNICLCGNPTCSGDCMESCPGV